MGSEGDDFTLVVKQLLNEIKPLKAELEMILSQGVSGDKELDMTRIKEMEEIMGKIDDLLSQLDSITEAHSGGKRKTKRRRNKKKHKTKKKRRRRRKK